MGLSDFIYVFFGAMTLIGLFVDLGLLSKKNKIISFKIALVQTLLWVSLALLFMLFLWFEEDKNHALQFLSAYVMEWSLSVDNIFVFIIIFSAFKIDEHHHGRALLIGILIAIILRVLFITVGLSLINQFHWIIYLFGVFLLYTGFKLFFSNNDEEFQPQETKAYKWIKKIFPLTHYDGNGKYTVYENGKKLYTTLFVVVILLAFIDLVFALDSIPAVMGISRDKLIVYTSNIFAVLGLRSLFFLLRGAVSKFDYLQQGISIVLVFIGIKMLLETWINKIMDKDHQTFFSLIIILSCILGSIVYSLFYQKKGSPKDIK
jgi:tellurite resistance protein TerC